MKNLALTAIIFATLGGLQVTALPAGDMPTHRQNQDAELPPWLGAYLAAELSEAYKAAGNRGSSGGTVTITPPSGGVNVGGDGGHPGSITVTGENGTENFGNGNEGNGGSITVTAPHQ